MFMSATAKISGKPTKRHGSVKALIRAIVCSLTWNLTSIRSLAAVAAAATDGSLCERTDLRRSQKSRHPTM